jgi:ATP-dependent Clp protease protease subunit
MKNKLLNLLLNNAQATIRIENKGATPRVMLNGVIDADYGISAASLIEAMNGIGDFELHINSPGGDVFEGTAMAMAIASHQGKVTAIINGVAASAATRVALAASEVRIADSGMFMIHNSWAFALGNRNELRNTADLLEKIDATINADYARKTGKKMEDIAAWMDAETWFNAQEALDNGFVDAIEPTSQSKAKSWNLSAYNNAPKPAEPDPELLIANQRALNARRLQLLQLT